MWYVTQASPTRPAVFGYLKPKQSSALYIETCCLPRIDSHETKETLMWPKHDVTGMCASELKTHPLSSWHLSTAVIAQPQPSFVTLTGGSCLTVAISSWAWVGRPVSASCGSVDRAGKSGLPHWMFRELSIYVWTEFMCILFF